MGFKPRSELSDSGHVQIMGNTTLDNTVANGMIGYCKQVMS